MWSMKGQFRTCSAKGAIHADQGRDVRGVRRAEQGAEAAFLVEREHWGQFMTLLKEEQRRLPDLRFEHTGPWPAYDFVRLDLNG